MIKEAIKHIQETALPLIREIGGSTFVITSAGDTEEIRPTIDHPDTLTLQSLDALVKLVQTEAVATHGGPLYITIPNHLTVNCFTQPGERGYRQFFYKAEATDVPGWDAKVSMAFEPTQIALRTRFQDTPDAQYLQRLLSDITTGSHVTLNDSGIATQVVTKKGVALQQNEPIKPIVSLKPYRTFQEIEQPESLFLIRVNEREICFIEADGGMWKLRARETVKAFLEEKLSDLVEQQTVIIAL